MKKRVLSIALMMAMSASLIACSSQAEAPAETTAAGTEAADTEAASEAGEEAAADTADGDLITVGYAQVGAESDWRTANTESFKSTFTEENGYKPFLHPAGCRLHSCCPCCRDRMGDSSRGGQGSRNSGYPF